MIKDLKFWILEDGNPVLTDSWQRFLEFQIAPTDLRRVAETRVGRVRISTVFIGLIYMKYGGDLWFEVIFVDLDDTYHGRLDNDPVLITGLNCNDIATFKFENIEAIYGQ